MNSSIRRRVRPDTLIRSVLIMIICMMVVRIILLKYIKNEGVGIMAAPFDFFMICYGFLVFGAEHAVSAMIRCFEKRKQFINARDDSLKYRNIAVLCGLGIGALMAFVSVPISTGLFHSQIGFLAVLAFAVCVFWASGQGAMRGIIEGFRDNFGGMLAEVIFSVLSLILPVIGAREAYRYGLKVNALLCRTDLSSGYGAFGAACGFAAAMFVSLIYLIVAMKFKKKKIEELARSGEPRYLGGGLSPVKTTLAFGAVFGIPFAMNMIDEMLFMAQYGDVTSATTPAERWGIWTGGVLPVVAIIICLVSVVHMRRIYEWCALIAHSDRQAAYDLLAEDSRLLMILLLPSAMFFAVLADTILRAVYVTPTDASVRMAVMIAPVILVAPVAIITSVALLRLRKRAALIINLVAGAGTHFVVLLVMNKVMKAEAACLAGAGIAMFAVMGALGFWEIMRMVRYRHEWLRCFVVPAICSAGASLIVFVLNMILVSLIGEILTIAVCILGGAVVYILLLMLLRGVYEFEVEQIPGGEFLVILAKGFHII